MSLPLYLNISGACSLLALTCLLMRAGLHEGRPHPGWMHTDFAQRDVVIHVKTAGNDYEMLLLRNLRLQLHANRFTSLAMRAVLHARCLAF
jgi:hypothetical protein